MAQTYTRHEDPHVAPPPALSHTFRAAFLLTLIVLAVEVTGGLLAHSLALMADAGHVLTDVAALGLAWWAVVQAARPPDSRRTYGYYRVGVLAAVANAVTLLLIVGAIAVEAIRRIGHPEPVLAGPMLATAAIGATVNGVIALRLHRTDSSSLNARAAFLHVIGDVGASLGVVVAAGVVLLTGWFLVDPIVSLLIAALIAVSAWRVLAEAVAILLEAVPPDIDVAAVTQDLLAMPGVCDVHDLHVWAIGGEQRMLSAHIRVSDRPLSACAPVIEQIAVRLRDRYRIDHPTIQCETGCAVAVAESRFTGMPTAGRQPAGHVDAADGVDRRRTDSAAQRAAVQSGMSAVAGASVHGRHDPANRAALI